MSTFNQVKLPETKTGTEGSAKRNIQRKGGSKQGGGGPRKASATGGEVDEPEEAADDGVRLPLPRRARGEDGVRTARPSGI